MMFLSKPAKFVAILALAWAPLAHGESTDSADPAQAMVQSEINFSRTSAERGIRESFLQFFAEDSIVFAPGPVKGKEHYTAYKDKGYYLTWQPVFAAMSSSGDLGITTGPWEIKKSASDKESLGYGQFFSVWKKQPDNSWKVVFDTGVENPKPTSAAGSLEVVAAPGTQNVDAAAMKQTLEKAEQDFAAALKTDAGAAVAGAAHDKIRVLRENAFPAKGKAAAKQLLANDHRKVQIEKLGEGMSSAGDLVYRYGSYTAEGNPPERGYYISVWRFEPNGQWKLLADLEKKTPPEEKK